MISDNLKNYLFESIKSAKAFLLLGAGASFSSQNKKNKNIKLGTDLAKLLCEASGVDYNDEPLSEVVQGVVGPVLGDQQFYKILQDEYTGCSAGEDLRLLFSYPWARAYTLNVDDAVERVGRLLDGRVVESINALVDKIVSVEGTADLQLIHLNGYAKKPEHGFIFSEDDYSRKLGDRDAVWYSELALDYHKFLPVIIGSKINEPILKTELERLKQRGDRSGSAILVTPDNLTQIQKKVFESKNIVHIQMTLFEFVAFLKKNLGDSVKSQDVSKRFHFGIKESSLINISKSDIVTAMALRPLDCSALFNKVSSLSSVDLKKRAKSFLEGAPPDWVIAASDVPVDLYEGEAFLPFLTEQVSLGSRLIVVTGMAGSGKATLAMRSVLKFCRGSRFWSLYELSGEAKNFSKVFGLLQRIHEGEKVIIYIDDLSIYGDRLASDMEEISGNNVVIVTTARSSEWREHFSRYLSSVASTFELKRFDERDYAGLADRILKYVPAPAFRNANQQERIRRFKNSKSQLLISLREVTESRRFDQIIEDEWSKIANQDARDLFYIVGLSTVARVGIEPSMARGIFNRSRRNTSFEEAIDILSGIVLFSREGRLRVRHEFYAEHIFDTQSLDYYLHAIQLILDGLSKYNVPLIKHLNKNDAALFKWLLNYRSIYKRCKQHELPWRGLGIYENFEKTFELDGHYWLQYGLYARRLGDYDRSMSYLKKSVEAFPENAFAIHALADLKLLVAADLNLTAVHAQILIEEAVADLLRLDARTDLGADVYPIITLATRHMQALVSRGQKQQAIEKAKVYFSKISHVEKLVSATIIRDVRNSLILYTTTGVWNPVKYDFFSLD